MNSRHEQDRRAASAARGPSTGATADTEHTTPRAAESTTGAGATFMISLAAELAGMHAQTLRTYDRLGLVTPQRTSGGGRRYSTRDVEMLREIQRLSQEEGVNLAGIKRIMELTNQIDALRSEAERMVREGNLAGASEINYGQIPALEKDVEDATAALATEAMRSTLMPSPAASFCRNTSV